MEKQLIFREKYVLQLKEELEGGTSLENYRSNSFITDKKQSLMIPNILKPIGLLGQLNPDSDFESAVKIFEAFNNLEPIQASDDRLWTYLSHVDLYPYMIKRWDAVHKGAAGDPINYILDHWFLFSTAQAGLLRHALSGLWWSVYLSVDENRSNKYELTEILFRQLDFPTRTLGAYKLGRHKEAVIGILEYIHENENLFKQNLQGKTRFITKHLNLIGGIKPISYYKRDFFKNELQKIANEIQAL